MKKVFEGPKSLKPNLMHYCPGCGHSIIHRLVAETIDELGIQEITLGVPPAGCAVLAYNYFDVDMGEAPHGRALAVATGLKRVLPDRVVFTYQGDGDIAAIGTAESIHAANRGEKVTAIFVNNGTYGMTGGQMAPTTIPGMGSTTTPGGRDVARDGAPLDLTQMLSTAKGSAYLARVTVATPKHVRQAKKAIKKAFQTQLDGLGFSLVEVLSPCPTNWKMSPVAAYEWTEQEMTKIFPLGVIKDITGEDEEQEAAMTKKMIFAGFGGQGVLLMGYLTALTAMRQGKNVTYLPAYGAEVRGGTANCTVVISDEEIASPVSSSPDFVIVMNNPSLVRFANMVAQGGVLLTNSSLVHGEVKRDDITLVPVPLNELAHEMGEDRAANVIMVGALAEATGVLSIEDLKETLAETGLGKKPKVLELNRRALEVGAQNARQALGKEKSA